jgi:crotonobetainyl-CoA:carnitine CoA-transferase CaiB-like acyl-CoA transferase
VTIVETGEPVLKTKLRAAETTAAALAAQAALICEIWRQRTGRSQAASLDLQGAGLALQSVNHQRVWKYPIAYPEPTYPTVAIYPTKDGRHVMINGGYPGLRNGLLEMLDCANTAEAVRRAVGRRTAAEIEDQAAARGLSAVQVRSREEWAAHPQGQALAAAPIIEIERIGDAPPVPFPIGDMGFPQHSPTVPATPPSGLRPLSGIRVLDLTHVIAGPTSAKTLAEQGATVLHIYSPNRPQLPPFDIDTGHGKLSAFLDLTNRHEDKEMLRALVRKADVFAQSYRPRSISSIFPPDEMAALRPGIVYVSLSCYGFEGPWRNRPGWEQLAQSATGIAAFEGSLEEPKLAEGFFPNDYITGFLAAIGTLAALIRRATEGGSWHVKVSLCRTAMILLDQGQADASAKTAAPPPEVLRRFMMESDGALGRLHFLGPVLRYTETPSRWDLPASPLGAHPPCWPQWG